MENMTFIGRKAEIDGIRNGFSGGGSAKGFLFTGETGIGKTTLLQKTWQALSGAEASRIWIAPNFTTAGNAAEAATALARGIDATPNSLRQGLSAFARGFGQKVFELQRETSKGDSPQDSGIGELLAENWVEQLKNALPELRDDSSHEPMIIFAIDDVDKIPPPVVDWFTGQLIPKFEATGLIERTRYIFAGQTKPDGPGTRLLDATCGKRLIEMQMRPLRAAECAELAKSIGGTSQDGENLRTLSGGNPGRLLQILQGVNPLSSEPTDSSVPEEGEPTSGNTLEGYSPEETEHLFRAAYLPQATKESLSLFCSPREASLGFNWIKNSGNLAEIRPDNSIALREDIRGQALSLHNASRPEEASDWRQRADFHINFTQTFPDLRERWIPLRLSAFRCFDKEVLLKLFSEEEVEQALLFIEKYPDFFEEDGGSFQMRHDILGLVRRYKSIMGLDGEDEELVASIAQAWSEHKKDTESKRTKLEGERDQMTREISGAEKEMIKLNELKDKLLQAFLDPARRKNRRMVSFKISFVLLLLGLTTIGLSLAFKDLFGPYHALAGIVLTIFGFFWPMTNWSTVSAIEGSQGMDRFAVETQQRMLKHRMMGLVTRSSHLRNSIRAIDKNIEEVDRDLLEPYLAES